jgi:hypothetical protein
MHWLSNLRFGMEVFFELLMATVDYDKVVCGGIHAMIVAVLVHSKIQIVNRNIFCKYVQVYVTVVYIEKVYCLC